VPPNRAASRSVTNVLCPLHPLQTTIIKCGCHGNSASLASGQLALCQFCNMSSSISAPRLEPLSLPVGA
jgi:hypothetical protein